MVAVAVVVVVVGRRLSECATEEGNAQGRGCRSVSGRCRKKGVK